MKRNVTETVRQDVPSTHGTEVDLDRFRYLWRLSHGKVSHIPLKADTVKKLLEWMVMQMDGRLIKKLDLTGIEKIEGLVEKVKADQLRRTVVRKQKQQQRAGKKKAKKKNETLS